METSSRRKACDTCFKKKIKCDMLKPACSNCLLYKVPCSTTVIRRRTVPAPPKETQPMTSATDGDSVEARLARIEAKLDRLGEPNLATTADQLLSSSSDQSDRPSVSPAQRPLESYGPSSLMNHEEVIPPLTEVLPVVDDYFRDFNPALPLFHQHQFMQMLYNFYCERDHSKKTRATWAAINIVLAIGYRIRSVKTEDIVVRFDDSKVKKCIDNAQKELDELVTREEDTLGIQVLLGLVILFQTNTDQKPASVLIGTAVRLAHRLQLHVKASLSNFPPGVARHRSNIFWLCYCLDKDISLRSKIPSIQNEADVDLDLPGTQSGDDGNYLQSIDGRTQFNYFRARVQLSYLEGKVYDYLLSNRSMKLSVEARRERVEHLARLLNRWLQTIPTPLRLENITDTLDKAPLTHMILLYHTYLMCAVTVNGLYSLESPWVKAINGFTTGTLQTFDFQSHACFKHDQALLPDSWSYCVSASRGCLQILNNKCYGGCNLWLSGCSYFSAFIVLLANIVYFPSHELAMHDRRLTLNTMERMATLLEHTKSDSFKRLRVILISLEEAADRAISQAKAVATTYEHSSSAAQPFYSLYSPSPLGVFPGGLSQNLAPESTWPQVSTLDTSVIDLAGFDFNDDISLPSFMQGFS
ncbi:hypothetical protein F5Y06DRAFT_257611 [Hypoxylon sp. FL0890]|nr:hypothetical protein F5Y06DRAFT_257611 [Hypoxylon sp. FL0890]